MTVTLTPQVLRRALAAAATVTLGITLTACGANFNAQTLQPYQPAEGTNADSGEVAVRNLLVVASEDGRGELQGAVTNRGGAPDTLQNVAAAPEPTEGGSTAEEQPSVTFGNVRPLTVPPNGLLTLPPPTGKPITVTGAKPGEMIYVTVTFGKAAPITTWIPVITEDHYSPSPRPEHTEEAHG